MTTSKIKFDQLKAYHWLSRLLGADGGMWYLQETLGTRGCSARDHLTFVIQDQHPHRVQTKSIIDDAQLCIN